MNKEAGVIGGIAVVAIVAVIALFATSKNTTNVSSVDQSKLVLSDSYKTGSVSPKVTVVEFGDYQCPACQAAYPILKTMLAKHADMQLVWRDFPLPNHKNAMLAARAVNAAGRQGQFWQMNGKLYETQTDWSESDKARDLFIGYARDFGLNLDQFKLELDIADIAARIAQDLAGANELGVNATPTLYFNGVKYTGSLTESGFEAAYAEAAK